MLSKAKYPLSTCISSYLARPRSLLSLPELKHGQRQPGPGPARWPTLTTLMFVWDPARQYLIGGLYLDKSTQNQCDQETYSISCIIVSWCYSPLASAVPSVAEPEVSQDHITPLPMSEETQVGPLIGNSALFKTSDWPHRILELRCQSDLRMLQCFTLLWCFYVCSLNCAL